MDTLTAYANAVASRDRELKVFDWEKAALIIKERGASVARAGLAGDWEYTGGDILRNGQPVPREETYVFLASTWATPELEIDGDIIDCYRMQSTTPGWDAETYWPDEAVKIIESN